MCEAAYGVLISRCALIAMHSSIRVLVKSESISQPEGRAPHEYKISRSKFIVI